MEKDNKLLVAAVILSLFFGVFFSQDASDKLSIAGFLVIMALTTAYNVLLFVRGGGTS